jgi:uncharacterized protein with PQ loop repeat
MVGMSAAFLTTLSFVPQIIIQDKKNEGCFEISYDSFLIGRYGDCHRLYSLDNLWSPS